jgi:hypothetical protein
MSSYEIVNAYDDCVAYEIIKHVNENKSKNIIHKEIRQIHSRLRTKHATILF